jgi:hypothetical protein
MGTTKAGNFRNISFLILFKEKGGLIDVCDESILDSHGWNFHQVRSFVYIRQKTKTTGRLYLHRVVMSLVIGRQLEKIELVDHINGNTLDNRRCNLRICSNAENLRNRVQAPSNNKSGIIGVTFCKQTGKWSAEIVVNQKKIWLGRFKDKEEARAVRLSAEKQYFGEFAHK